MNASDCEALASNVQWSDATSLIILNILLFISLMVIVGNLLVIAAVYTSAKLRTVTNLFIVSLAVADLMVGLSVLPFSAVWEVYKVWVFGDIWCSIWLAVDVWMCTSSILNLCAISLDRYVAVTRPVSYPSIMSSSRAKYLIAFVWILSFVICFPPLAGWKDRAVESTESTENTIRTVRITGSHTVLTPALNATDSYPDLIAYHTNYSEHYIDAKTAFTLEDENAVRGEIYKYNKNNGEVLVKRAVDSFSRVVSSDVFEVSEVSDSDETSEYVRCPWTCELTNDTGYVIYSALGSFFIPMTVMLFFYYRIYLAASRTTKAINQGFRTTKGAGGIGNRFDEQRLTLRIHRGRGSVQNHHGSACSSHTNLTSTNGGHSSLSASPSTTSTGKSPELRRSGSKNKHDSVKISVSYPSTDQINNLPNNCPRPNEKTLLTPSIRRASLSSPRKTTFSVSPPRRSFVDLSPKRSQPKNDVMFSVHYSNKNGREVTENVVNRTSPNCYLRVGGQRTNNGNRSLSIDSTNSGYEEDHNSSRRNSTRSQGTDDEIGHKDLSPSPTFEDHHAKQKVATKMGKKNIKTQVKRFRVETKAAKTLAIIVGGFILCWMPFFTIYLIRAFCTDCINQTIFSVLFWLGYCNSAINPCIYALFSKDFRFAFKRVIYRCLCGKKQIFNMNTKRRGSDASYLKTPHRNIGVPRSTHVLGEDSDPGASDSR